MTLARLGVIGDIHAEDLRLERALGVLQATGAECCLSVGDIADGRGDLDRCVRLLEQAGAHAVRGNHDRWLVAGQMRELVGATLHCEPSTLRYLATRKSSLEFMTVAGRALLCHGFGDDDMSKLAPDDGAYAVESNQALTRLLEDPGLRFVLNGHSHRPMLRPVGGLWIINAGTLRPGHGPSFVLVDFAELALTWFGFEDDDRVTRERQPMARALPG